MMLLSRIIFYVLALVLYTMFPRLSFGEGLGRLESVLKTGFTLMAGSSALQTTPPFL